MSLSDYKIGIIVGMLRILLPSGPKTENIFFGEILNGKMQLSRVGVIADILWHPIPYYSKNVELGAFLVMPDHIHGIIIINRNENENLVKGMTERIVTKTHNRTENHRTTTISKYWQKFIVFHY